MASDMTPPELRFTGPDAGKSLDIRVDIPKSALPTTEAANYYQLARFGLEIELLACYLDPQQVAQKAQQAIAKASRGETPKIVVQAEVVRRLAMSPQGFETLRASVDQMAKAIAAGDTK